jgi:uncharacterized protein YbjT (DUF2867 family)
MNAGEVLITIYSLDAPEPFRKYSPCVYIDIKCLIIHVGGSVMDFQDKSSSMVVAVIGASGGTGQATVDKLLQAGHQVLAFSRQPADLRNDKTGTSSHIPLDLTKADLSSLTQQFEAVDAVVFAAGGNPEQIDRDGAILCIQAAVNAKVSHFVLVTSIGAGRKRPANLIGGFWDSYFGAKEASENALRESGLAYTILQPAELINVPGTGLIRIGKTGELPIEVTPREDLAALAVASLQDKRAIGQTWEVIAGNQPITDAIENFQYV